MEGLGAGGVLYLPLTTFLFPNWTRICKRLRSPAIDSEESISPDGESTPGSWFVDNELKTT